MQSLSLDLSQNIETYKPSIPCTGKNNHDPDDSNLPESNAANQFVQVLFQFLRL
jgi:hypothetical protein